MRCLRCSQRCWRFVVRECGLVSRWLCHDRPQENQESPGQQDQDRGIQIRATPTAHRSVHSDDDEWGRGASFSRDAVYCDIGRRHPLRRRLGKFILPLLIRKCVEPFRLGEADRRGRRCLQGVGANASFPGARTRLAGAALVRLRREIVEPVRFLRTPRVGR